MKKIVTYRKRIDGWEYWVRDGIFTFSSGPYRTKKAAMKDYARYKKIG